VFSNENLIWPGISLLKCPAVSYRKSFRLPVMAAGRNFCKICCQLCFLFRNGCSMAWMQYLPRLNSSRTKQPGRKYYSRNESWKKWPNCSLVILCLPLHRAAPLAQNHVGVSRVGFFGIVSHLKLSIYDIHKFLRKPNHMIGVAALQMFQTLMPPGHRYTGHRCLFCRAHIT
jgi:hypothetical protein